MPVCCIVNCRKMRKGNQSQISYHRFPKNENLRRKWLDAIGVENINSRHKTHMICSLHFDESSFNRTLDVVRLREDSVPSIYRMPLVEALETTEEEELYTQETIIRKDNEEEPIEQRDFVKKPLQSDLQKTLEMKRNADRINQLTERCKNQRVKIKRLHEMVRKRNIKIAVLNGIIADLKSEASKVLVIQVE